MEREDILYTVEKWFDSCTDEFLEELEELESSLEGGESLCGHIDQAKSIIAKIKFINHKIVEFQNNGMSTKQLIAQKKNLEEELMKKKIIVDNTHTGTEVIVTWKRRVENVLGLIRNSEATEIEKALLDMQLTEAVDNINSHIIGLEKNSRRTGVLFKTVKELELTNESLANENGFLKQRLSKLDKQFKETMTKKVMKLDNALEELGDIKHLKSTGPGTNADDVSRSVRRGGVSFEMELIDSYQEKIHVLDSENKDLIAKVESLETENDEYKEELMSMEAKLKDALREYENLKHSEIAAAHPLVKLDGDDIYSLGAVSTTLFSDGFESMTMSKSGGVELKRKNTMDQTRKGSAMVSTITMQDGKELEILKIENEKLKAQLGKVKNSLNTVRRQSIRPRMTAKTTQTVLLNSSSESSESEESTAEEEESEEEQEEIVAENSKPPDSTVSRPTKKKKKRVKVIRGNAAAEADESLTPLSDSSELTASSEEEVIELPEMSKEELEKKKQERANSMVASLKSFVNKKEREKIRNERKKRKESMVNDDKTLPQEEETQPVKESFTETESEGEKEEKKGSTPAELAAERKAKQKKKVKKRAPKRKVKFEDTPVEEPEPEIPTFQRVT